MAQRDPLVEYQREGFAMFNAMLDGIKEESVTLLFHAEIQQPTPAEPEDERVTVDADLVDGAQAAAAQPTAARPAAGRAAAPASDGRGRRTGGRHAAAAAAPTGARQASGVLPRQQRPRMDNLQYSAPTLDSAERRTSTSAQASSSNEPGRNAPCPCGSGKKYKRCHGAPQGAG
jgi:preprotein translocase subunit SecA